MAVLVRREDVLCCARWAATVLASHPNEDFSGLLRRHRLRAGLSQEALAERAGLSVRGLSDLERGVRRAPYPATIARLAEALALDAAAHDALLVAARRRAFVVQEPAPASTEALPARTEERRWVTVVAIHLAGFAAFVERFDPEDAQSLVDQCTARISEEIRRFDGTILRSTGDALLAVFGAPNAHEDDAERAVRAALAVRDCALPLPSDATVEVRVGIDTGEVLAGFLGPTPRREYGLSGAPVNVASGLAVASEGRAVVVSEQTFRATSRQVRYAERPPLQARDWHRPLALWEAVDVESAPAARVLGQAPFVGRDRELDALLQALARVRHDRRPHLVSILGEAGIGKSRLVAEFERRALASGEVRLLRGRCLSYGEVVGYGALAQALYAVAGITTDETADTARARLHTLVHGIVDAPVATETERHLALLCGLDSGSDWPGYPTDERGMQTSVRRFFEACARVQPVCLLIEDLHWGDEALLNQLEDLAERTLPVRLLIVTQARPELLERRATWGGGVRAFTSLPLEPLDSDATLRLADALCRERGLAGDAAERVSGLAGGNPLFAEELCATLAEGREAQGVPTTLRPLISARLDALPADEKRALQNAAVLGHLVWQAGLAALEVPGDLPTLLDALERRDLLRSRRSSRFGAQREFAFKHDLIQEMAYGLLPRTERRRLHARILRWLEETAGERIEERLDLLAHHAVSAEQHDRALDYLPRGADRARRAAAHREEAALLAQAIAIAAGANRPDLVAEFHARRGRALARLGNWQDARDELETALSGLTDERAERRAEVLVDLAMASNWMMDGPALRQRATEALEAALAVRRPDLASDARFWQAWATGSEGDVESSIRQYAETVAQTRERGIVPAPSVLPLYMTALCWAGQFPLAVVRGHEALRIAREAGDTNSTILALQVLGLALAGTGAYDDASQVFAEALRYGREYGIGPWMARATAMSAGFRLDVFDYAGHAVVAEEACELARGVNFLPPLASAHIDLLLNLARTGDLGRVDRLIDEVGAVVVRASMWHGWLWKLRFTQARAEIALARGDAETAIDLAGDVVTQAQRHRPKYEILGRVTRAAGLERIGRSNAALADLRLAVETARALADPAVFLRAAAAKLAIDADDALLGETRAMAERIVARLPTPPMRASFLAAEPVRLLHLRTT